MAARIRLDEVENTVCRGHRSLHTVLPNGQMYLSSSRAKSNGILIIGVRKSHAAKFRISRLDEVRKFLALTMTTATKIFPTQLRTKIRRYNIIFEILNSIFSKLAVSSW